MADSANENICPFCGQVVLSGNPLEECGCEGAFNWRGKNDRYVRISSAIHRIFGENCHKINPSWEPVDEEVFTCLCECAEKVCFDDAILKITLKLGDDSTAVISDDKVIRKKALKCEAVD